MQFNKFTYIYIHTYRYASVHTDIQTYKHTYRQTSDRQTDRQTYQDTDIFTVESLLQDVFVTYYLKGGGIYICSWLFFLVTRYTDVGPQRDRLHIPPTKTLHSCWWPLMIFSSLPRSRLRLFTRCQLSPFTPRHHIV